MYAKENSSICLHTVDNTLRSFVCLCIVDNRLKKIYLCIVDNMLRKSIYLHVQLITIIVQLITS